MPTWNGVTTAEWEWALLIDRAMGEALPMVYRDHVLITVPLDYLPTPDRPTRRY